MHPHKPAAANRPMWLHDLAPQIQVVFCDLDDTLLDAQHRVPARTAKTVGRLHAAGVRFALATGRTVVALRTLFGGLLDRIDYVAGNGTDVVVDGAVVYHEDFPLADARKLYGLLKTHSRRFGFVAFDESGPHLAPLDADFVRAHVESLRDAPACPDGRLFAGKQLGKVGVVAPEGAREALPVLDDLAGDRFVFAPTGPYWIDVLPRGVDKAQGIARMLDHLGFSPNQALAFGDSMNDATMMEALPHTVAVSNAMPELKALCSYQIGSNLDEAVLDCLDQLAMLKKQAPALS